MDYGRIGDYSGSARKPKDTILLLLLTVQCACTTTMADGYKIISIISVNPSLQLVLGETLVTNHPLS